MLWMKVRLKDVRFALLMFTVKMVYPKHIITYILHQLKDTGKVQLLENSKKNMRTFLYNEDSCRAVIALIDSPEALDGSIYNVATDEEISIVNLVKMCGDKMGKKDHRLYLPKFRKSDPMKETVKYR